MLDLSKDNDKIINYIRDYHSSNNIQIRNKLIEECYEGMKKYAFYFYKRNKFFEAEEYIDIMVDTFFEVIEKFKVDSSYKFLTYFTIRARGNIYDCIRKIRGRGKKRYFFSLDNKVGINKDLTLYNFYHDIRVDIESEYLFKEYMDYKIKIYHSIKSSKKKEIFRYYFIENLKPILISKYICMNTRAIYLIISELKKEYFPESIKKYRKKS